MARLVVSAVVGVAVGYFFGPQAGFAAFSLAYGATGFLDPHQKVQGPRLNDLKAPQATYGAPIAYIEGAPRGAWNIAWASDKREIANTQTQGKGGPGVDSTTFTYEMDVLYLVDINGAAALRRVWSNGKLVWSNADDADGETLVASSQTTSWRDIRFYTGASDQLPDPTYEAAVGVGEAPAYRGRCTIFVEGLNLGGSGQMPVLTFEVLTEASTDYSTTNFATFPLTDALATSPAVAGITAMEPGGFDFLYGVNFDAFNGGHTGYAVFHVAQDGSITETATFDYGAGVGMGTGEEGNAFQGNSDESVLVVSGFDPAFTPMVDHFTVYKADGSSVSFPYGVAQNLDAWTFSKRGSRVAIASSTTGGLRKVRIYDATNGTVIAVSSAMATEMQFCAIGDGVVYALDATGDNVYELDLVAGTLNRSIATPLTAAQSAIACAADGTLYLFAGGDFANPHPVYRFDGASTWTKILNESRLNPTVSSRHAFFASNELFGVQNYDPSGSSPFREQFYLAVQRVAIVTPGLDQVVRRLCLRTGQLTDDDIDVTALSGDIVRAMAITQATTTRGAIEILMGAYLFECVEGEKLKFVKRGGASVASIPYADMGASQDGTQEPLPLKRLNDPEIAARVSVKFANVLNDFQDGLVQSDRLVTESTAEQVVEVPLGFTPTEAARLADANTMDLAVQLIQIGPVALPRKYSALEPTDVVTLTDALGDSFRARIMKGTIGGGVLQFELVLDDASVTNSVAETDSNYASSTLIRLLSDTDLKVLDIPILRDADDHLGPYAAVSAGSHWAAAQLDKSVDGTAFSKVGVFTTKTAIGTASTALGNFTGSGFDDTNTVTVDVGDSVLSSSTKVAALAGTAPAYLIGHEIVYACTATLVSPGIYRLSSFLRGMRGTEWAISGHAATETVVLLQTDGLRKVSDDATDLNVDRFYRATTFGKSTSEASVVDFVDTGVALKPFAPVDLMVDRSDPGAMVVSWHRRSRLASSLFGAAPPLGEASESYDVELYDASDVLVSDSTVTSPEWALSGLDQTGALVAPIAAMQTLSGTRVGIRTDTPSQSSALTNERFLAFDSLGTVSEQSPILGIVAQWAANGTSFYAVTYKLTNTVPSVYSESKVWKFTLGTLPTADASATAGSPGDWLGIAFDGSNPWVSEQTSGNLRKLNASTLASVASYAITGGPAALAYSGGKLWVALGSSSEVARWDIATHSEDFRFSVSGDVGIPLDLLVSGSHVFVFGSSGIAAYSTSAGVLLIAHAFAPLYGQAGRTGVVFGSEIAVAVAAPGNAVLLLDATTGARDDLMASPETYLAWVAGAVSSDLYLTVGSPGSSWDTRIYEAAAPGLSGYSVKVYQNSATVGRGYPATLEL